MEQLPGYVKVRINKPSFSSSFSSKSFATKKARASIILNEIRKIRGVKNVWFTDNVNVDLLAELEVKDMEEGNQIENAIRAINGVKDAHVYVAIPA